MTKSPSKCREMAHMGTTQSGDRFPARSVCSRWHWYAEASLRPSLLAPLVEAAGHHPPTPISSLQRLPVRSHPSCECKGTRNQRIQSLASSPPWRNEHSSLYSKAQLLYCEAEQSQQLLHQRMHLQRRLFGLFPNNPPPQMPKIHSGPAYTKGNYCACDSEARLAPALGSLSLHMRDGGVRHTAPNLAHLQMQCLLLGSLVHHKMLNIKTSLFWKVVVSEIQEAKVFERPQPTLQHEINNLFIWFSKQTRNAMLAEARYKMICISSAECWAMMWAWAPASNCSQPACRLDTPKNNKICCKKEKWIILCLGIIYLKSLQKDHQVPHTFLIIKQNKLPKGRTWLMPMFAPGAIIASRKRGESCPLWPLLTVAASEDLAWRQRRVSCLYKMSQKLSRHWQRSSICFPFPLFQPCFLFFQTDFFLEIHPKPSCKPYILWTSCRHLAIASCRRQGQNLLAGNNSELSSAMIHPFPQANENDMLIGYYMEGVGMEDISSLTRLFCLTQPSKLLRVLLTLFRRHLKMLRAVHGTMASSMHPKDAFWTLGTGSIALLQCFRGSEISLLVFSWSDKRWVYLILFLSKFSFFSGVSEAKPKIWGASGLDPWK